MALTEKQWQWIAEGIQLAVAAVLAAVRAAGDEGPLDWSSLRITNTPEMALEEAKKKRQKSEVRSETTY